MGVLEESGTGSFKEFLVAVNLAADSLADLALEERCLTAEVVRAQPWIAWAGSKRENDPETARLGARNIMI